MSDRLEAAVAVIIAILSLAWAFSMRRGSPPSLPKPRVTPLTLRISNIPGSIVKGDFEKVLAKIAAEMDGSPDAPRQPGMLGWSFAASGYSERSIVATATFHASPSPTQLESAIKRNMDVDWSRLRVDLDFFGLTPLADPPDPKVDVIAVTGLAGHAFGSWKSRDKPYMWLRDFLPESIPDARILSYGYDTKLPGSHSTASILDLSRKFLESVKAVRSRQEKYRPIIFIGHSLGGLVVKQAIVQAAEGSQDDIAVFMSCYAVVFFGVPNRGLDGLSLISMVKGQPNEDLVGNLRPSSPFLNHLHDMFYQRFTYKDSRIICFYEIKETPTVEWSEATHSWERTGRKVMMVPMTSATHIGKNEQTYDHISIDADHSDMVKFSDPSDRDYIIIESRIRGLANDAPGIVKERITGHKKKLSETEAKCVRALNAPNFAAFKDNVEDAAPGTFRWLLQNEQIKSWISKEDFPLLWIRGSPGQGKTVLSKFLLDYLSTRPSGSLSDAKVIYFFCYDQDERFRTSTSVFRSLIKQLLTSSNFFRVADIFDTDPSAATSEDSLWEILRAMFDESSFGTIYCIIDALDECEEGSRKRLLLRITRLVRSMSRKRGEVPMIKLLVTSRPLLDITIELGQFPLIDLKANPDDLKLVINRKVRELTHLNNSLQDKAAELLLDRAERTFLWVSIVLKKLKVMPLLSLAELRDIIKTSPTDLNELYQGVIEQVMQGSVNEQKLLAWVVYGRRPLTLMELEAALATQPTSRSKASTDEHQVTIKNASSAASVILDITDNKVHLIHQSAKDFLVRGQQLKSCEAFNGRDPNIYLAKICIVYLSFEDFETGPCGNRQALTTRKNRYPLYHYAARNWHAHIQGWEDVNEISPFLDRLTRPMSPILLSWSEAAEIPNMNEARDTWGIATKAGITWLAEFQLRSMTITEEKVKGAAENRILGYEMMKRLVSTNGAVFAEGAVCEIARSFDGEMMRLLLERKIITPTPVLIKAATANRKSGDSVIRFLLGVSRDIELTPDLIEVAANNKESGREVMELLLRKKDIKIADGAIGAILQYFDAGVVRLLLEEDITVTEAIVAAVAGNRESGEEIMQLLLDSDDVHLTAEAVAAIVRQFDAKMAELLLRRSDARIGEGVVATIVRRFDARVARLLLEKTGGIEVTEAVAVAAATNGRSGKAIIQFLLSRDDVRLAKGALAAIVCRFDAETTGLLLSRGEILITQAVAKAFGVDNYSETVECLGTNDIQIQIVEAVMKVASNMKRRELLSRSAENRHEVVVQLLLEYGVHPNFKDRRGWTPLSWASRNSHLGVVEMLLAENPDVNAAAAYHGGRTALQAAAEGGHIEIVERLLAANADVNAAAAYHGGRTALQAAAEGGHIEIVERLLAANADVNAAAAYHGGRTALQAAAEGGHIEIVERLLAANADVNAAATGYGGGQTALSLAAARRNETIVKLLLGKGANSDSKPISELYKGHTPRPFVAEKRDEVIDKRRKGVSEMVAKLLLRKGVDPDSELSS
ncbi:hypothetical protein GP486_005115 [Trichoglossum hirsutum]|uniref:NACHT domain-containing protein n=1 Tax=Trichoglossum hirsutum TaxID=265104 RepID=A0A9P8RNE6_9PEZI|nr:hypothetical protein GP486_005115 [Trichoglossum hirsutum]